MPRAHCDALDKVLDSEFEVLDSGFVRIVDYLGNEASIANAARVSYKSVAKSHEDDVRLLQYLISHRHTSPFEMCEIVLHVRVPMDCWRQWIRHRTASVNEVSTRYTEATEEMQSTEPDQWRQQSTLNKQGSAGPIDSQFDALDLSAEERTFQAYARRVYRNRIEAGVAREQARKDLPLSTYTEAYWKIDLHNLLHFLGLRLNPAAQWEIRQYATVIAEIVRMWVPNVWDAFENYRLDAVTFSRDELVALRSRLTTSIDNAALPSLSSVRSRREFAEKLDKIEGATP